jgi:hypothetical protein
MRLFRQFQKKEKAQYEQDKKRKQTAVDLELGAFGFRKPSTWIPATNARGYSLWPDSRMAGAWRDLAGEDSWELQLTGMV